MYVFVGTSTLLVSSVTMYEILYYLFNWNTLMIVCDCVTKDFCIFKYVKIIHYIMYHVCISVLLKSYYMQVISALKIAKVLTTQFTLIESN